MMEPHTHIPIHWFHGKLNSQNKIKTLLLELRGKIITERKLPVII